jgi:mannosyltransferase
VPEGRLAAADPAAGTSSPGPPPRAHRAGVRRLAGWAPPLIPGIVLLLADGYRLGRLSLWRDEAYAVDAIGRPLPRVFAMLAHTDAVNGAYYVLMHAWAGVAGTSPAALRLPSLPAMAVAAVVTAAIGGRLARAGRLPAPAATGVVAGLLFTAVPQVTRYAQDARAYGFVTMCATVATYLLLRALADGRWRWWAPYGAAITAVGLFNLLAFLLVAAHGVTVWIARARQRAALAPAGPARAALAPAGPARAALAGGGAGPGSDGAGSAGGQVGSASDGAGLAGGRTGLAEGTGWAAPASRWLTVVGVALAVLSPLLVAGVAQRHQISWLERPGVAAVSHLVAAFAGSQPLVPLLGLLVLVAVIATVADRPRVPLDMVTVALPWLLLPAAVLLTASQIRPVYDARYLVFCLPALGLLGACGVAWVTRFAAMIPVRGTGGAAAWLPAVLILALLAALVAGPQRSVRAAPSRLADLRGTAAVLAAQGRRGDAVLYVPPSNRVFSMAYPALFRRLRDVALAESPAAAANLSGAEVTAGILRERFARVGRVWVVSGRRMFPFPDGGLEPAEAGLLRRFSLVRRWYVGEGMLSLYVRQRAGK